MKLSTRVLVLIGVYPNYLITLIHLIAMSNALNGIVDRLTSERLTVKLQYLPFNRAFNLI